ncbi:hypothetical protein EDF56_104153 [Novosphingobium sp. PhB165]|uniref:hypothetical protein n=1 Tax=Novosphingobium sp. PhB165 TaxID=2485105 RepID=UPI0010DA30C2|nr:hypothetical protein [Novosphingobium sp. PhB165]TCM18623.1 hypothetical protein EDF56_104153 [Novosphingobium sp. PhB165]
MAGRVDTALKLALAAAALIAGSGVGYYYGVVLPAQAAREEARESAERDAEQARQKAAEKAQAEQQQRQESAQLEYQDCLNFAELSYKERWTASCHAQHEADVAAFQDCSDNLFATEEGCRAKHPIRPERDCALPGPTAQSYSDAREQRKNECLARLQAAQGGGQPLPQQSVPQMAPQPMQQAPMSQAAGY